MLFMSKTNKELRACPTLSKNIDSYTITASNIPPFLALNCMPIKTKWKSWHWKYNNIEKKKSKYYQSSTIQKFSMQRKDNQKLSPKH